jgi:NitT/TauT family transport system ATP-binding protein
MITHSIDEAVFLSDKIIVLTKNSAKIKKIIKINLPKRDQTIKNNKVYISYLKKIRTLLR